MKKIFAVCASVIAVAAMSVCAFAEEAPTNDVLLIAPAPEGDLDAAVPTSNNPSAPITPDDGTSSGSDKSNTESNAKTGSEGLALCAAVVLSGAVMIVSSKRR